MKNPISTRNFGAKYNDKKNRRVRASKKKQIKRGNSEKREIPNFVNDPSRCKRTHTYVHTRTERGRLNSPSFSVCIAARNRSPQTVQDPIRSVPAKLALVVKHFATEVTMCASACADNRALARLRARARAHTYPCVCTAVLCRPLSI